MQKKRRYSILSFGSVLLFIAGVACQKPAHIGNTTTDKEASVVISPTLLSDSIPEKILMELKIQDVKGIKVNYGNGLYSSYFEYEVDPRSLFARISNLPFLRYSVRADTTCRPIAFTEIESLRSHLNNLEIENAAFFWDAESEAFQVYECIKTPIRHTFLVSKNSNRILHRVEFFG